ncbi:FMN-dependent NADH-azoreductase [Mycolicibacterium vaccae]|uniref:FMN dependent NADH:quinone oxidoreductase n=1 Tax=Mycolicibacterium vaccae ATCC 25954 TaxID=1194972 RepID=K0V0W3_MYCVA|nr:NAD(P)H-dependent oxidoreductase [Mycolicibacterium vaccae]ANI41093.1 FMN-dependent NADH-azoreductase [Mycolicibacterium vaccae 95051]EJZ12691.1 NAD(P)H dehydrogenase (quinone) [Mycolicibacterium vaccae ATCC 25954]MCV7061703.1 NAD(P)H-dependent oxidoreductase [Mycolicibacterium vaccae]
MPHLLHIDTSIQAERSVTRRLTARAAGRWRAAHPAGTVTYRDIGSNLVPHLDAAGGLAAMVPPQDHTPAQAASYARNVAMIEEIKQADTVLLGLPLYNFGPPSVVKAWVDRIVVPGVSFDPVTQQGLLAGTELIVLAARGGGYGSGAPREGWDHAEPWLPHALSLTGMVPRFISAELTMAADNPAMAGLVPLASQSLADAEAEIDTLWAVSVRA